MNLIKRTLLLTTAATLGLALPAPCLAQAPVDELGAGIWHMVHVFEGVGFREAVALSADSALHPSLRSRIGLRVSSAAALYGALRSPGSVELLGSFHEIAPSLSLLAGGDAGVARLQGGLGLSYQVRLAQTQEAAVGVPIVPGAPGYGTLKRVELSFDPGADAVFELSVAIPLGFRVAIGAGLSAALARLILQPSENANLAIAFPHLFLAWSLQLGLRYEV